MQAVSVTLGKKTDSKKPLPLEGVGGSTVDILPRQKMYPLKRLKF
jgi:hypothetical protein